MAGSKIWNEPLFVALAGTWRCLHPAAARPEVMPRLAAIEGHPDAGASPNGATVDVQWAGQGLDQSFGGTHGICLSNVLQQNPEFVASQARHGVRLAHALPQPVRDSTQHCIPRCVPQTVVDHLEAVDVQEEDRDVAAARRDGPGRDRCARRIGGGSAARSADPLARHRPADRESWRYRGRWPRGS